jgi:hypothetical protein
MISGMTSSRPPACRRSVPPRSPCPPPRLLLLPGLLSPSLTLSSLRRHHHLRHLLVPLPLPLTTASLLRHLLGPPTTLPRPLLRSPQALQFSLPALSHARLASSLAPCLALLAPCLARLALSLASSPPLQPLIARHQASRQSPSLGLLIQQSLVLRRRLEHPWWSLYI